MTAMKKVFFTGATGFVGTEILNQLLDSEWQVKCLVRPGSAGKLKVPKSHKDRFEISNGDVTQRETLAGAMSDCQAVIHIVGIIREYPAQGITFENLHYQATCNVVDEAKRSGIEHLLFMSALGTRENARSRYHLSKFMAEQYIKNSKSPYTIFRPSIIFGPKDKFINLLKKFIRPYWPVMIPGNGKNKFQPVAVEDIARGYVASLLNSAAVNQCFEVGGQEQLSFNELIDLLARLKGVKHYIKLHLPVAIIKPLVKLLERSPYFPLTTDQLAMLSEDNVTEDTAFWQILGFEPVGLEQGIKRYI